LVSPPPSVRRAIARDLRSSRRWCETCRLPSAVRWSGHHADDSVCLQEGPSSGNSAGASTCAALPVPRSSPGPGPRACALCGRRSGGAGHAS
jgi:hypothetical protein